MDATIMNMYATQTGFGNHSMLPLSGTSTASESFFPPSVRLSPSETRCLGIRQQHPLPQQRCCLRSQKTLQRFHPRQQFPFPFLPSEENRFLLLPRRRHFSTLTQSSQRNLTLSSNSPTLRFSVGFSCHYLGVRASSYAPKMVVRCSSSSVTDPPTVSETKLNFLKEYKRPIPSIYNTVLQELIVQQHLMRYKRSYRYDAVFALGFVTVYEQLMEGYPSDEDRDAIFQAYIKALNEDPEQYRVDAKKLEEWARAQNATSLVEFSSREGEVEGILKDIAERAGGKGDFSYSRFFAIGLFRLLELANAMEPTILEKLCAVLNVNKRSVDRDLDVYRNLLSKLVQAKELLKEYVDREKKKRDERAEPQKTNEAITQQQFSSL